MTIVCTAGTVFSGSGLQLFRRDRGIKRKGTNFGNFVRVFN
jgi:hypothetical protein